MANPRPGTPQWDQLSDTAKKFYTHLNNDPGAAYAGSMSGSGSGFGGMGGGANAASGGGFAYDPTSAAITALITGGLNYYAGERANDSNERIARDATLANMSEAEKNRAFQAGMSNSAYQRSKKDLESAGLNPLLLAGQSAASTPSGSTGSAETAHMENTMTGALSSARDVLNAGLQIQKTGADIGLTRDQQDLTKAQTGKAIMETKVMSKGIPEADLKNNIYNWAKDKFNKMKNWNPQSNPNPKGFESIKQKLP